MNRYDKARKELAHYFGAYGEALARPAQPDSFHAYSLNARRLMARSAEAFSAFEHACRLWQTMPAPGGRQILTLDQLRKGALAVVDIFEIYGIALAPIPGELE